jgi:hypothetical protein
MGGVNIQIKDILKPAMHAEHRLLAYNIVVYAPTHKAMAVYRSATSNDGNIGTREYLLALPAPVFQEYVTRLPLFDVDLGFILFQIDYPTHKRFFTDYITSSERDTSFASFRYRRGERKPPFWSLGTSCAEASPCASRPRKYAVSLIVEVGALVHKLKFRVRKLRFPENRPIALSHIAERVRRDHLLITPRHTATFRS